MAVCCTDDDVVVDPASSLRSTGCGSQHAVVDADDDMGEAAVVHWDGVVERQPCTQRG